MRIVLCLRKVFFDPPKGNPQTEDTFMNKTLIALAAAGAVLAGAPAAAEETVVRYHDLNLASEKGQKTLERRIEAAVRKVCADTSNTGTRLPSRPANECIAQARAAAKQNFAAIIANHKLGG